eukprot:CAMPEP_0202458410 /NCGR_PEP_ID=MMETSP1360-20130828/24888_1 /ASSEMBLY_ACC=CAM_ASM_000848 /TAXON_ID=515479 /ORGANISM="Licmophora paradoxa, Strain CCMP2313" /LENGTH=168 /DNA_ID=CAMNT_0049078939 /DNA_START=35 /DNA_END=541 /DNA_ORIENTATION=-
MTAVAPTSQPVEPSVQPISPMSSKIVDSLPTANTTTTSPNEDDDLSNLSGEKADADWDEGGPSQCGYSETVHSTLMTVGEAIHGVIGDPSPHVEENLKQVGVWFQEASYATRDILRGNKLMVDEDELKVSSTMGNGKEDDKKTEEQKSENKVEDDKSCGVKPPEGLET